MKHKNNKESFEEEEMRLWKRRLWGAWVFAIPIAILMILERFFEIMPFGELTSLIIFLIGFFANFSISLSRFCISPRSASIVGTTTSLVFYPTASPRYEH